MSRPRSKTPARLISSADFDPGVDGDEPLVEHTVATQAAPLTQQDQDKPTSTSFRPNPLPSNLSSDRSAARSEALLRAVPPYTVETLVDRLKADLGLWLTDFFQCDASDGADLILKLEGVCATAEVAIREIRELLSPSEESFSDRPGFPQ